MPKKIKEKKDASENQQLNEQSSTPEQPIVNHDDQQPSTPEQAADNNDDQQPSTPEQAAVNHDDQQPSTPEQRIVNQGPPNIKLQRLEAIKEYRKNNIRDLSACKQLFPPFINTRPTSTTPCYSKSTLAKLNEQKKLLEEDDKENTNPKPSFS